MGQEYAKYNRCRTVAPNSRRERKVVIEGS
jgi:hypothetical protein